MPEERKISKTSNVESKVSKMSYEELKLYEKQLTRELDRVKFYLQKTAPTHKRIRVTGHK